MCSWKVKSFALCSPTFPSSHPRTSNPLLWIECSWELVGGCLLEVLLVANSVTAFLALQDKLSKGHSLSHYMHSPQSPGICAQSVLLLLAPYSDVSRHPENILTWPLFAKIKGKKDVFWWLPCNGNRLVLKFPVSEIHQYINLLLQHNKYHGVCTLKTIPTIGSSVWSGLTHTSVLSPLCFVHFSRDMAGLPSWADTTPQTLPTLFSVWSPLHLSSSIAECSLDISIFPFVSGRVLEIKSVLS